MTLKFDDNNGQKVGEIDRTGITSASGGSATVTNGAGRGTEEFIPGFGGGVSGSTYFDITANNGASTIRVQTIDTPADRITPTARAAAAAARIQFAFPNDQLLLVPK